MWLLLIVDVTALGYHTPTWTSPLEANTYYSHWAITNPLMMVLEFWWSRTLTPSHVVSSYMQGKQNKKFSSFPDAPWITIKRNQ